LIQEIAASDARVHPIESRPLPDGWAGKPHACWQGTRAASEARAGESDDWFCFVDCDTVSEPALLRTAVHAAADRGLDFLSLEPFQKLVSFGERLLLPAGFFLVAFTLDVRQANDPNSPEVHANGQFILMQCEAYEAIGTHAAVRGAFAEDSELARLVKQRGRRIAVLGTQNLIATRMYRDFPSLWQGLSRQAGTMLRGRAIWILIAIFALLLGWTAILLPMLTLLQLLHRGATTITIASLAFSWAASLALLGTHIGAARYFKIPFWYGLIFPFSYTLGAGVALNAAIGKFRKTVRWKGRTYAPGGTNEPRDRQLKADGLAATQVDS
jgi:chlorobactene glucosyltransferase